MKDIHCSVRHLVALLATVTVLIPSAYAQDLDAQLDECEAVGYRAGGFAMRAACAVLTNQCPAPFDDGLDFQSRTGLTDGFLNALIRDTCQILFQTACEQSSLSEAIARDGDCAKILNLGPDQTFSAPSCPDHGAAIDIFAGVSARLCNQKVPEITPGPAPPKEAILRFSASGHSGVEAISGIQIVGDKGINEVIMIKCEETLTGQLKKTEQECTTHIPSDIDYNDVRDLKIIFANPVSKEGEADNNILISGGQVWFAGRNIWRSAIDSTQQGVRDNDQGQLDALRLGTIYWNEGTMHNPPSEHPVWFEAKGGTGNEVVSIYAKLDDGTTQSVAISCSTTKSGQLLTTFQRCSGQLNANRREVQQLVVCYDDSEGSKVIFKEGRLAFFGVNVLWKAENPMEATTDVWKLRAGIMAKSGAIARVNHHEYEQSQIS